MKIFYGVQGTGNGHLSRARMMARHLNQSDADVTYLFSGRPRENYFDMGPFGDFLCLRGFTFAVKSGTVSNWETLRSNNAPQFITDVRRLDLSDYDLVVTDFEPICAWAAKLQRKPIIGMGHQYAFGFTVPVEGDGPVSRMLLKDFAPAATRIGLHWSHFGQNILPPIIDPDLRRVPGPANKIIVYLPFEDQKRITALLRRLRDYDFYQYSPDLIDTDLDNVRLRKTCHDGFKRDLCSASGVICNAGFELVSECIHLGHRVLVKPLKNQTEQLSNARAIVELNLGQRMDDLLLPAMADWLSTSSVNRLQKSPGYPDVAGAICTWLLQGDYGSLESLRRELWRE